MSVSKCTVFNLIGCLLAIQFKTAYHLIDLTSKCSQTMPVQVKIRNFNSFNSVPMLPTGHRVEKFADILWQESETFISNSHM